MERNPSGIKGLDEILGGGFIPNSSILLCGSPGSGKSNLALNFLYSGIEKYGQRGLFLSLEQPEEQIISNAKLVFPNMDWDKYLGSGILVKKAGHENIQEVPTILSNMVHDNEISRVVIDSVTVMQMFSKDEGQYRLTLFKLLDFIRSMGCTALFTAEKSYSEREKAEFTIEDFVADGVIILYSIPKGELRYKALEVLKMRGIDHQTKLCPFKITPSGIQVYPVESVFWLNSEKGRK